MKTEAVKKDDGYHITFTGKLDLMKTNYLRNVLLQEFKNQRVCFDLKNLSFVGSNGILHFFTTVNEVALLGTINFQINGLNEDFKKIVKSFNYPHLTFDFVSAVATVEKDAQMGELIEDEWLETNPGIQKTESTNFSS
jgi:anti-anti-sigma regulatory factor